MLFKKTSLIFIASSLALPLFANAADLTIINNTDIYGTGYVNFSPCSSRAGDKGILKPHQPLTVPGKVFSIFCLGFSCEAHVYGTQDCSGKELAAVTIDPDKGVTKINNYDKEHFAVSGTGTNIIIDPVNKGWKNWFNWLF